MLRLVDSVASRFFRSSRVPVVMQLTATECGLACIAMVLRYYGRYVTLNDLRAKQVIGRGGASATALIALARCHGLEGRGVSATADDFEVLPPASVLHWSGHHYVVFQKVSRGQVWIVDPAVGRRRIALKEAAELFTGVALTFSPTPVFNRRAKPREPFLRHFVPLLWDRSTLPHIAILSLVSQIVALLPALGTRVIVDAVIPSADVHLLYAVASVLVAAAGGHAWTQYIRSVATAYLKIRVDRRIGNITVSHLLGLPYDYFRERSTGDLMMRVSSIYAAKDAILSMISVTAIDTTLLAVYFAALWLVAPAFTAILAFVMLSQSALLVATRYRRIELTSAAIDAQSRVSTVQVQVLTGIVSVKACGLEGMAASRWLRAYAEETDATFERSLFDSRLGSASNVLRLAAPLAILVVGSEMVIDRTISLGAMLSASAIAAGALAPLAGLLGSVSRFGYLETHLERARDLLMRPTESMRRGAPVRDLTGELCFESVRFRYDAESQDVLSGVTFSIRPRECVALVGPSGSGKSTIAKLAATLYAPNEGRVLFDGADAQSLDPQELRGKLGIVSQSAHVFGDTLRSNIASDDDVNAIMMEWAIDVSGLTNDVKGMAMGLDTPVGEAGALLSGGQLQRLAIARAVARRPRILILDEATSSLDAITEATVLSKLRQTGCTILMIAHRPAAMKRADRIVVLDGGKIVASGTHQELVLTSALYAQLSGSSGAAPA